MNQKSFESLTRDELRNIEGGSGDPVCYNHCLVDCNIDCGFDDCVDFCYGVCAEVCGF